jgi:hypothetical protein
LNKYKFIEYLHHPKNVTAEQQQQIVDIVSDYPYFQSARSLMAKVKSNHKDPEKNEYINSAALYVVDRTYFKKFLESDLFFIETKESAKSRITKTKATEKHVTEKTASKTSNQPKTQVKQDDAEKNLGKQPDNQPSLEKEKSTPAQKDKNPKTPEAKDTKGHISDSKKEVLESSVPPQSSDLDKLIEEVFKDMADLRKSKARFLEWQEKYEMEEALEKVLAASAQTLDQEKPKQNKEKTSAKSEIKKDKPETKSKVVKKKETPSDLPQSTEPSKSEEEAPGEEKSKSDQSSSKSDQEGKALKSKEKTASQSQKTKVSSSESSKDKSTSKTKSPKKKAPKTEETKAVSKGKKPTRTKKATTPKKPVTKKAPTSGKKATDKKSDQHDEIINKFIEKQPSISKPTSKAPTEKDDLAKTSTRFHADIASEYLAEIYIEQGKKDRAIEIYENLSLKFPEKKSYFAGLIENLKKE